MTLADVAAELYALPPGEFTAARNERARRLRLAGDRDGARAVAALRRPTLAAWAVDLLVRRRPDDVEALLALGPRLLEAQAARDGDRLRALDREQHRRMAALRADARSLAAEVGQRLTDAVDVLLENTLRAAMTDAGAAAAVRSGLLVTDLESTGFGPVDVGDAVAVGGAPPLTGAAPSAEVGADDDADEPVTLPRRRGAATARGAAGRGRERGGTDHGSADQERGERKPTEREREQAKRQQAERRQADRDRAEREQADHELADAESTLAAAERDHADAGTALARAADERGAADAEVERLTAALAEARARQRSAARAEAQAASALDAARACVEAARRRAVAARDRRASLPRAR